MKRRQEAGATAVEYALIIAGIAAVIILTVLTLGGKVAGLYSNVETNFPSTSGAP